MDLLETDPDAVYALTDTMDEFERRGPRQYRPPPPREPPPPMEPAPPPASDPAPPPASDPVLEQQPELQPESVLQSEVEARLESRDPEFRAQVISVAEYNSTYGLIDGIQKSTFERIQAIAERLGEDRTTIMVRNMQSMNDSGGIRLPRARPFPW